MCDELEDETDINIANGGVICDYHGCDFFPVRSAPQPPLVIEIGSPARLRAPLHPLTGQHLYMMGMRWTKLRMFGQVLSTRGGAPDRQHGAVGTTRETVPFASCCAPSLRPLSPQWVLVVMPRTPTLFKGFVRRKTG